MANSTMPDYPLIHPYGMTSKKLIPPLKFTRGEGIYVFDEHGKRYINAASGVWNLSLGLGNEQVKTAMVNQLDSMSFFPLFYYSHDPAINLAARLIKLSRCNFNKVFLTCSGSEGVDLAIKTAILYHCILQYENKNIIVSLDHSYHGTTYASLSASGLENNRCFKILPRLDNFKIISSPYCYRCPCGSAFPDCQLKCVIELENLFQSQASNIAALIVEPVLASAGNVVPPEPYFSKIQKLCRDYNVLLIVDEVATGLGRCGEYFASDLFGIKPDILIVSKGLNAGYLPIGAVLFSERIISVLAENQVLIPHGSSQDGNPIACTAALATLNYIHEAKLLNYVQTLSKQLFTMMQSTLRQPIVGDIRGIGLMLSIELVEDKKTKISPPFSKIIDVMLNCIKKGLLVYPFDKGISIFPPLNTRNEDAEEIVSILSEVLSP